MYNANIYSGESKKRGKHSLVKPTVFYLGYMWFFCFQSSVKMTLKLLDMWLLLSDKVPLRTQDFEIISPAEYRVYVYISNTFPCAQSWSWTPHCNYEMDFKQNVLWNCSSMFWGDNEGTLFLSSPLSLLLNLNKLCLLFGYVGSLSTTKLCLPATQWAICDSNECLCFLRMFLHGK